MLIALSRQPVAQLRRQHLHVAGEHDEIDVLLLDDLPQARFLLQLVAGIDRQVVERHVVPSRQLVEVAVVGDDRRDLHVQAAGPVAVEQIVEAVAELGHQQQQALRPFGIVEVPFHAEPLRHIGEAGCQFLAAGAAFR